MTKRSRKRAAGKSGKRKSPAKPAPSRKRVAEESASRTESPLSFKLNVPAAKDPFPDKARAAKSKAALGVTPEERQHMIAIAAYVRAEKRGFVGGDAVDDWLHAEAEIDALLRKKQRELRDRRKQA
jgi:hypothetical protein